MSQHREVVLASGNQGKLNELRPLLAGIGWHLRAQSDWDLAEAEEPHPTFIENSLAKARHASRHTGLAAIADDSGLCVSVLGNAPGVLSARYAADLSQYAKDQNDAVARFARLERAERDALNNQKLVQQLQALGAFGAHGDAMCRAYFVSVIVFVRHVDDPEPIVSVGRWHGQVLAEAQGKHGFGYDAHFYLPDLGMTAAQLSPALKNRFSHRAQAVERLLHQLRQC